MKNFRQYITELSPKTLSSYEKKATAQSREMKKHTKGEYGGIVKRMLDRRQKGLSMVKNKKILEDGMGGGAVSAGPTNVVGSGAIAGAGQPPGSKSGEPGVDLRKRKKKVHDPRLPMGIGKRKDF